ncbi:MAG: Nucleoside-triphosphatase rdgB [Verrucomicrobiales bacterium]|nr:Nucleoside-triphosphatase rdgB [Verrucomicrobiales bacterium]
MKNIYIIVATRNMHKVDEIRAILGGQIHYLTLNDFPGYPPVLEDTPTFEGNARKKSISFAKWIGRSSGRLFELIKHDSSEVYILADDSGLEVDVLSGAPGVHSARFAASDVSGAGNSPDSANNAKLLRLLMDVPKEGRTARFRSVIALTRLLFSPLNKTLMKADDDLLGRQTIVVDGACEGTIAMAASGKNGFGYDPLFYPQNSGQSFAEITAEAKNKLSHRGKALEKLKMKMSL